MSEATTQAKPERRKRQKLEDMEGYKPSIYGLSPDFPTGAEILGTRGIDEAYRTGRGKIRVRAVSNIETGTLLHMPLQGHLTLIHLTL